MILKWLLSRSVRQALQMRKHVWKLVQHQRDLLSSAAMEAMEKAMLEVHRACRDGDKTAVETSVKELETVANKHLRAYPNAGLRENVEVLLVAIAVAMAIRTFFLQPFKIPTGSMQPTLWGVHTEPLAPDFKIPNRLSRFVEFWVNGVSYEHIVAKTPGTFETFALPSRMALFNLKQQFSAGGTSYTIWFPADNLFESLQRDGYWYGPDGVSPKRFKAGEDIMKVKVHSGDHLFVDRLTYNFRRPKRGEIIVFETRHVFHPHVPQDQFYIKRLVGLGDEKLQINKNRHLVVNGQELTASTPHFENLYGPGSDSEAPNHYYRHNPIGLFENEQEFPIPHNQYVVMGDNTKNSLDSRYWGSFPRDDVIGKAYFIYWPISSRFGWGYR